MGFKKIFKREPPANGGNTFELEKLLNAKEDNINEYIRADLGPNIIKNQYTFWELLQFQADYFASTLQFTFKDNWLDPKLYLLMRCHFLYGNVGLLKRGDDFIPIVESTFEMDSAGNLKKVIGYSAFEVSIQTGTLTENQHKFKTRYVITKKDIEENYARLHVGSWGFGAIVRWTKFILQQESLLKKIYMYSYLLTKKITYNVNDVGAANIEVKRFFSDDYPFLINMDTMSPSSNKFEVEGAGKNGVVDSESIFYYYEKFLKIYYEMLGRRMNTDRKGERNITSEVEASQEQFLILENEMKINKTNFLEEVKRIVGKDYIILNVENQEVGSEDKQDSGSNGNGEKVDDISGMNKSNKQSANSKE